jgi:hypothetical protein
LNSLDLSTLKPALYLLVLTSKDKLYKSYIIKQ